MKKIKLFDINLNQNDINGLLKIYKSKFWASGSGIGNVDKFEKLS